MSKRTINIERLRIRLHGVPSRVARSATRDLGSELLGQLASPAERSGPFRAMTIGKIDAGRVVVTSGTTSAWLRNVITHRIADSIKAKLR